MDLKKAKQEVLQILQNTKNATHYEINNAINQKLEEIIENGKKFIIRCYVNDSNYPGIPFHCSYDIFDDENDNFYDFKVANNQYFCRCLVWILS